MHAASFFLACRSGSWIIISEPLFHRTSITPSHSRTAHTQRSGLFSGTEHIRDPSACGAGLMVRTRDWVSCKV